LGVQIINGLLTGAPFVGGWIIDTCYYRASGTLYKLRELSQSLPRLIKIYRTNPKSDG